MHIKAHFAIRHLEAARAIVAAHPFATLVTADLRATHMPCLLDDDEDGAGQLVVLSHVAKADPVAEALDGPLLIVFQGRTDTCPRAGTRARRSPRGTT